MSSIEPTQRGASTSRPGQASGGATALQRRDLTSCPGKVTSIQTTCAHPRPMCRAKAENRRLEVGGSRTTASPSAAWDRLSSRPPSCQVQIRPELSTDVGLSCQVQIRLDIDPLGLPIDEIRFTGIAHRVAHDRSCHASDAWRFVSNVLLPIDPAYHHLVGGSRLVWTLREASGCLRLLSANFVHTGLVHLWLNCVALLHATSHCLR